MTGAREHSRELSRAFTPVRIFLLLIGQMPFGIKRKKDGTVSFRFSKLGPYSIIFALVFAVSTVNYLLVVAGIISFFIEPYDERTTKATRPSGPSNSTHPNTIRSQQVSWELYYVQRELVTICIIWSWMTVALVGSSHVLFHGHYYVHYFNYWNRVIQVMNMDVTHGVSLRKNLVIEIIFFLVTISVLVLMYFLPRVDVISDASSVLANFYFRLFKIDVTKHQDGLYFLTYRFFGLLIMLYGYAGSRANLIQFLFFVRCLTNASKIWNERLKVILEHDDSLKQSDVIAQRINHRLILKDHYVLVQLFKMTDSLFSRVLLAYYSLQIMTVVLGIYQLITLRRPDPDIKEYQYNFTRRSDDATRHFGTPPPYFDNEFEREAEYKGWDRAVESGCVVLLLLLQETFIAMMTTRAAAKAYEEGMNGYQILRRSSYLNCKSKTERNFVHSLVFSYARNNPLNVTAGGYFAVDKTLIPALLGTVLNYVVAVYTLQPDRGLFFQRLEGDIEVVVEDNIPSTTIKS